MFYFFIWGPESCSPSFPSDLNLQMKGTLSALAPHSTPMATHHKSPSEAASLPLLDDCTKDSEGAFVSTPKSQWILVTLSSYGFMFTFSKYF